MSASKEENGPIYDCVFDCGFECATFDECVRHETSCALNPGGKDQGELDKAAYAVDPHIFIRACDMCGRRDWPGLKRCNGCYTREYCSVECQMVAWRSGHKGKFRAQREMTLSARGMESLRSPFLQMATSSSSASSAS